VPLDDVLAAMRASRAHLAAVVDEEGRGIGLVTMEDVLKELVGTR
jgi:CBS domain containing-hemolysin-like protein